MYKSMDYGGIRVLLNSTWFGDNNSTTRTTIANKWCRCQSFSEVNLCAYKKDYRQCCVIQGVMLSNRKRWMPSST